MKVVLLGKGEMLANLIRGVRLSGSDIVGVFRYERTVYSRLRLWFHDFFQSSSDVTLIKQYKLHEIKCKSANSEQFKKEILRLNADIILVGTWKERLRKDIIDLPVIATINVHPSYLPKYRGPNPYLQTILHGEKQSGITFHLMSEEFDKGAILLQQKIDILDGDTSKELKNRTVFQARLLTCDLLKKLDKQLIEPVEQDENGASYYPNITGDEKMLDFKNQTSIDIINTIRALYPYLPTYITINDKFLKVNPYKVEITDFEGEPAQIIDKSIKERSLTICCSDKKALRFSDLKLYKFPFLTKRFMKNL